MWFTRMIELINSWGLLRLHLCRALLSSCFKGYKYRQFLYFELLPYIKRNHKEYLETCKHWEKQSTSFIHRQVRMMNALSRPLSRRPVTHSCPVCLTGVCTWSCTLGWAYLWKKKLSGIPGFSLCLCERDGWRLHRPGGISEVFLEGEGHGNIVYYPIEHIILSFFLKKIYWLYSSVITVSL